MKLLLIILSVLPGILGGDYNARTLSVAEQDSILAVSDSQALNGNRSGTGKICADAHE